jgi:hypothetical protein
MGVSSSCASSLYIWMGWLFLKIHIAEFYVGDSLLCSNRYSFSDMSWSVVSLFCSKSLKIVPQPRNGLSWVCASSLHIWNGWLCLKIDAYAHDVGFLFSAQNRPKTISCNEMELCCFLLSKIADFNSHGLFWLLCLFKNSLSPLYKVDSALFCSKVDHHHEYLLFSFLLKIDQNGISQTAWSFAASSCSKC